MPETARIKPPRPALAERFKGLPWRRHLIAMAVILVLCVGLFLWAGATYLPDAADYSTRLIVNDDYGTLTEPLDGAGEIRQTIEVKQRIFGVVLDVTTYNRVARGTLHLRLENAAGEVVVACDTDMTKLKDNTFHRFVFDRDVRPQGAEAYALVLTSTPETPEDVLGFHRSSGAPEDFVEEGRTKPRYPLDNFALTQNGQPVDGVLALQYVDEYAGGFIYRVFSFFAAFLTVFLLAVYAMVFILRAPVHRVFALCAAGLGFVFLFLIPHRTAPDEYVHITVAYRYANTLLGTGAPEAWKYQEKESQRMYMRAGDEMLLMTYDEDATDVYAYREMYEGLFERDPGGDMVEVTVRESRAFPPLYAAPTLGVVLARLAGLGKIGMLTLGRLCNLAFYIIMVSLAVKRMPVGKPIMAVAALLPMSLQLAASFSHDCYVIALSFYFIALCLDCALARESVSWPQLLGLAVLAMLLAPAKAVYLLLLAFVFFIPRSKFPSVKLAWLARGGILVCAMLVWLAYTIPPLVQVDDNIPEIGVSELEAPEDPAELANDGEGFEQRQEAVAMDPNMPLRPNGDAYHTFGPMYILRNLPVTLKLLGRSVWEQSAEWLQGVIGGKLGEPIAVTIELNWLLVIALLGALLLAALPDSEDPALLSPKQRLGAGGVALAVAGLLVVTCLGWTPINYKTLFGFQGRYLLPVLPLVLLALRGRLLRLEKPIWRQVMFATAALVVLCQLNAFTIICQF